MKEPLKKTKKPPKTNPVTHSTWREGRKGQTFLVAFVGNQAERISRGGEETVARGKRGGGEGGENVGVNTGRAPVRVYGGQTAQKKGKKWMKRTGQIKAVKPYDNRENRLLNFSGQNGRCGGELEPSSSSILSGATTRKSKDLGGGRGGPDTGSHKTDLKGMKTTSIIKKTGSQLRKGGKKRFRPRKNTFVLGGHEIPQRKGA